MVWFDHNVFTKRKLQVLANCNNQMAERDNQVIYILADTISTEVKKTH